MKIIKLTFKCFIKLFSVKFLMKNENITGEIINIDSGQRLAWNTPDIINVKE